MVSRANLSGRPRPSGVLKTVQDGPDPSDDLAVAAGDVGGVTGPRRQRNVRRREQNGGGGARYIGPDPDAPVVGIDDPNPDVIPDFPDGKGPDVQVPPSPPRRVHGPGRRGGGAGYRARTGNIARETTEAQESAGRGGRFGEQHIAEYGRTRPLPSSAHPMGVARYGGGAGVIPRWETGVGGGGYGTDPGPLPEPEPPPEETPPDEPPPTRPPRDGRRGGRRGGGGRGGRKFSFY